MHNCYQFRHNSPLHTSSGKVNETSLKNLSSQGYQLVVNLLPNNAQEALDNEKSIIESQGVRYFHIPIDFTAPYEDDYQQFCQILQSNKDKKIHIHCAANYRASAFYSVYCVENNIWSVQQALAFIADIWAPEDYPVWHAFLKQHGIDRSGDLA